MPARYSDVAIKAISLADLFALTFGPGEGGQPAYKLELGTPEGSSTHGGKQALQPIKLVPAGGRALVIGLANATKKTAELRSFEVVKAAQAEGLKDAMFPLDPGDYQLVLEKIERFFVNQQFEVQRSLAPSAPGAESATRAPGVSRVVIYAAAGLAILAALAAVASLLLR
jgi:hypothetical protein